MGTTLHRKTGTLDHPNSGVGKLSTHYEVANQF